MLDLNRIIPIDLHLRRQPSSFDQTELARVASELIRRSSTRQLVYTAFDGDHYQLCGLMRRYVIEMGHIPVNPESVIGYKDAVDAHGDKRGVIMDDLSVLKGCNALWVFTELAPNPDDVRCLAEGVIIELLFHLHRDAPNDVRFVSTSALLNGDAEIGSEYRYTFEETLHALGDDQSDDIMHFVNSRNAIETKLRPVVYHMVDPLDFKYAHWLRPRAYSDFHVPLVPGLAVEIDDSRDLPEAHATTLVAWAKLCSLATFARVFTSVESTREPSVVSALLKAVWLETQPNNTLIETSWQDYPIPKIQNASGWPITSKECPRAASRQS